MEVVTLCIYSVVVWIESIRPRSRSIHENAASVFQLLFLMNFGTPVNLNISYCDGPMQVVYLTS